MKLGILISGRGSNMRSLLEAKARGGLPAAEFAVVFSNDPSAAGLETAREHGVPTVAISHRDYKGRRAEFDREVVRVLREHGCEGVVLAGYMRVLGEEAVRAFTGRIVNIHPALLPSFPGIHAQKQALDYGVRVSGCTVHFVDEGVDTGPIILQKVVPVEDDDTEESLGARILEQEHRAIVEAVDLFSQGRLQVKGRRVRRIG